MATIDDYDKDDDEDREEAHINWSNLIFLPFHPIFKLIVICSVITKSILGPIQSVYPIVYCWQVMDRHPLLSAIKFFYWYCADPIYGIDTFLHIVHRQVTDEAMKREHLPKSAICLILDFAALIPFFRLLVVNDCPPAQFWPNILSFNEILILYRVFQYHKLSMTHSVINMIFGFLLLMLCLLNGIICFWLLLTYDGLCAACNEQIFDWRNPIKYKFNETAVEYTTYMYGMVFVLSFLTTTYIDDTRPFTIREYIIVNILIVLGYLLAICIIIPKIFAETILRHRRISSAFPFVQRLVAETKRRNRSVKAYESVENFYNVMWKKRSGITHIPEVILELPRTLRIDIKHDLGWALFQHSPTLRKTSTSFKRYVIDCIMQDYKLPGEKFFAGPQSHSSVYYIKSGVVQILSEDEGMTPILSVTGGTIFGDISFYLPPWRRKVIIKCLTYCEVIYLTRHDYIRALHRFPEDRSEIMQLTQERIQHAKILYACKQNVRGLDRAEDEGIFWVKRRWWELSDFITNWKTKTRKEGVHFDLPPEESEYHCAKYIGQLVLCTETQLLTKSLFANVDFPWLFVPHSSFIFSWRKIVLVTVTLVLFLYPPYLTARVIPIWFKIFQVLVDLIYAFDICISLLTAMTHRGSIPINFASVMFARCKTLYFNLDFLSTIWIEYVVVIVGNQELYNIAQANRLIKIYILFTSEYSEDDIKKNPLFSLFFRIVLSHFCVAYISGYFVYSLEVYFRNNLTLNYFFGEKYCEFITPNICDPGARGPLGIVLSWLIETMVFSENPPRNLLDIYIATVCAVISFMIFLYCKTVFITGIYLKYREIINFQNFVSNLKKYYEYYKIHQDLLKRLDRYLICHWKYYYGADIMHPHILMNEPYDIYWKVQGEVAERIISQSEAFLRADPLLVKDLAYSAKFLILPRTSTLFLFGVHCKMVTWVVQGHVKCEYHNEEGELLKVYYPPGYMLSASSVFLGNASLRTYSACTDCEILYIKIHDFYKIIKEYPNEWSHLDRCISEFAPIFDEMFHKYVKKHKNYQKRLRDRIFHARRSTVVSSKRLKDLSEALENRPTLPIEHDFWTEPESDFMQYWMLFRAVIVVVSILNAAVQGGSGAVYRRVLTMIGAFCDCIAWIDIVLKLFMAYYDEKGILIYDKQKCMLHYLTRGFVLDIIGCGPWHDVINELISINLTDDSCLLINTFCKFAHLYILIGFLNYMSDRPSINVVYIKIFKLQLVMVLILFGACHYLMTFCVDFEFDDHANLVGFSFIKTCWLPTFFELQGRHDNKQHLHLLYAESINFAQCGLVGVNSGGFVVNHQNLGVGVPLAVLLLLFWYVMGYSLTLLVLNSRGNTLFQHGVTQLRKFLTEERVDTKLINRAVAHFTYWWRRTKGINIQHLTNERIGVVFRQDLSYYFFKNTFLALDTLLQSGENLCRQLASVSSQIFILPGDEIVRQMDLTSTVYVVHRGKVIISKNEEVVATLRKGSIFGQLKGTAPRPVRISAQTEDYADLLLMNINQFQDLITDQVRQTIAANPTSNDDYMGTKIHFVENPYDSIKYILRGRKTILLPWMSMPKEARRGNWYSHWLHFAWLAEPFATVFLVMTMQTLTLDRFFIVYFFLIILDTLFLVNLLFEFFTVELVVVENKCVSRTVGYRMFKKFSFYVDVITLIIPLLTFISGDPAYQMIRVLRLRLLYLFNAHFCKSFKSRAGPAILKFAIVILLLHALCCGWIVVACKKPFPIPTPDEIPGSYNYTVNTDEWVYPENRPGGNSGCARLLSSVNRVSKKPIFVVPAYWYDDYILAMTFILMIHTHMTVNAFIPVTIEQIYYQVFITFVIFIIDIWIMSVTINFVYTSFRELYQYDFNVNNLITYLRHSGLSPVLLGSVKKYTSQLWERQRGNWLPELAQQAPMCLREDLLCALYQHHLEFSPLLRELPSYFKRQLAARLKRIVLFPGKCIVAEGDILPCIYFIHEGEVEKWYIDKDGENRMMSLYTTNGYFGQLAGLFPNFPFQFSFYSRTVVDLVYLHLRDWQDLLDGYPDIKRNLYASVKEMIRASGGFGKS